ncbi:GNAT family N-acetyltransferase [Bacillus mesophilus]|uniref:GNAT family N-acetyltransferase n=2 Tax=Bacillus mesophilus TaxID=1808955 RepID=A0A6M0QDL4_9BACI|nr:GNAT family N-acetyltransferase [Bacillus mesophilus]NEY73680.1 GNAT family N-acetyltransferase [Bacillus mesophilus]
MIRHAQVEDIVSIAKIHVDSWRSTYKNIVSEEVLNSLSYEEREELWKKVIPNGGVFVALDDTGNIVGFASGGKERTKQYQGYEGEVYAIYLLEDAQRKGFGRKLVQSVVNDLKINNIHSLLIWVLEDNPSCLFYEALGGQKIDSANITIGGVDYTEVAYGWKNL